MATHSSILAWEVLWTEEPGRRQAPLSLGILQARILEWVAMLSSRGSSQPRDRIQGLPHCRQILYHLRQQGSPLVSLVFVLYTMVLCNDKNKQITAKQKCMIKSSRYNIVLTCQLQQNIECTIPFIHNSNKDRTKHFR